MYNPPTPHPQYKPNADYIDISYNTDNLDIFGGIFFDFLIVSYYFWRQGHFLEADPPHTGSN